MNQTLNFLENVVNTVCNVDIRKVDRHRPYVIARTIYYGLAKIYTDLFSQEYWGAYRKKPCNSITFIKQLRNGYY